MTDSDRVFIIAEAGVNHNGAIERAVALVDVAADAGADAVKFQTFRAGNLVSASAPKAAYQDAQVGTTVSQFEMLRALELSPEGHHEVANQCARRGIAFMSTPFDSASLRWLCREFDMPAIKISSGDLTNAPLLLDAGRMGKPIILSTGMADLTDITEALGVLAFALLQSTAAPSESAFREAGRSDAGRAATRSNVTLLQCTTDYPAAVDDLNLRAMQSMSTLFGLKTGFSDHSQGMGAAVAAAALGATIIEKHFTTDRTLPGPDHAASLEPSELRELVRLVRQAERALGNGVKNPSAAETLNRTAARRSLVALRHIRQGEAFSLDNVGAKRPGSGVSPIRLWDTVGKIATRNYEQDDLLDC